MIVCHIRCAHRLQSLVTVETPQRKRQNTALRETERHCNSPTSCFAFGKLPTLNLGIFHGRAHLPSRSSHSLELVPRSLLPNAKWSSGSPGANLVSLSLAETETVLSVSLAPC